MSCYILDTFNKLSIFHISTKSPSLIFEQIFSGWFTCPLANGACQACQNISRSIPIYSFTKCDCAAVLAVTGNRGNFYWIELLSSHYCMIIKTI